jgi:diguanylate cyclase (GGDEF)-like protein/PAS domain S-box-containing protein
MLKSYLTKFPPVNVAVALFCVVLIGIVWAVTTQRIDFERTETIAAVMKQNSNLVIAFEEHTVRTIKGVDQALQLVKHRYQQEGLKLNIRKLIKDGEIDDSIFIGISVNNDRGDVVLGSNVFKSVNTADREYFKAHRRQDDGKMFISKPVVGRVSGKWSVLMTRRINKADGTFGGVAVISVNPVYFTNFYQQANLGEKGLVELVGLDGVARARLAGEKGSFGDDYRDSTLLKEQAKSPVGTFVTRGRREGVARLTSYRSLREYPLVVAVGTSQAEALTPFYKRERNYYIFAALASAFVVVFAAGLIVALSRQRRANDSLARSEARVRASFNQASVGITETALDGRFMQVNQKLCNMLGYSEQELLGRSLIDITHPDDRVASNEFRERLSADQTESFTAELETRYIRKDGGVIQVLVTTALVRDAGRNPNYYVSMIQDITERKELQERLLHQANYDGLTELPNRGLYYDRLKQALNQAQRRKGAVGVLFIDLDRFKNVNDTLGHELGDQLLKQVAGRLAQCIRAGDTVGRLGGDEFAIILSEMTKAQDSGVVAQKVIDTLAKPFQLDGTEVFVTASIGIATYPDDSKDGGTLVKNADAAMLRAKGLGKNTYQFHVPEMNVRALERMQLETDLRRALERKEFLLHFQPKASLASGEIIGCEALLRWRHPDKGIVSPAEFIPLLEDSGLIVPVGEWVIHAACEQIRAWQQAGIVPVPIAVNLSPKQFQHQDICAVVDKALDEHAIDARFLEVEITESTAMQNAEDAIVTLRKLKAHRVHIAIDDFGTGYSSLSYLKRFPIDFLKLDRSFVTGLPENADDASITRAVITMAHSLNLKVIAEGVETKEQLAFLASNGCDEMQGYYFSRPLPAPECTQFLQQRRKLPVHDEIGKPDLPPTRARRR